MPAWQHRHTAGEVPGFWPYGLDELRHYTDALTATSSAEPSRASVLRSRLRDRLAPPRRAHGPEAPNGAVRHLGLTWDENAARRMSINQPVEEMYSGVIWVTDILARGGEIGTMRQVLRRMNGLWVISRGQQDAVQRLVGEDGPPVGFFRFGVDEAFFTPAPAAERPLVLSVGGDRDRDTATLFAALALVHERSPHTEIVVQTSSALTPPDGVRTLPRVSHRELAALYARASVVAIATRENLHASGMTVSLEAMATARPVVMTRTPGIEDYVFDGETGYLTPVGDPAVLAARVLELLADPALAATFGAAGRRAVEQGLTTSHMVRELAALTGLRYRDPAPAPDAGVRAARL
ncbi:hypothetical protein B7R25_07395 [Subtercola boreus]|uniref:D-inositol 3-phosphate glycosyltransferase n=1 Tax=Subtercola boreus TaxID=120213 RepID=A0A3E0WDD3_9MICO|nr:hypothetical protein B7R24_07325 [Subtercola boreus]RFA21747.1 hypothetical protein B7R23_07270 [Subtercola boreus]RFA27718.1 hypothetical protein B7R25_07395 [Subtercola boreus]